MGRKARLLSKGIVVPILPVYRLTVAVRDRQSALLVLYVKIPRSAAKHSTDVFPGVFAAWYYRAYQIARLESEVPFLPRFSPSSREPVGIVILHLSPAVSGGCYSQDTVLAM